MNRHAMRRLRRVVLLLVGAGLAVAALLVALQDNVELYQTPSTWSQHVKVGQRVKLGGVVQAGSVHFDAQDSAHVTFIVSDFSTQIVVEYHGLLPALFREEKGVVAIGTAALGGKLMADQVLAKHDENYRPPDVAQDGS